MSAYWRCLLIDALFEGGRMTVGAVSIAYLLSTGLPLEKIAYLKIIQSIVLLVGELPTGVFADAFGSRKSLIAGSISSALGLLIFACFPTFPAFCLGEILTALALCFWSGAYESFSIEYAKLQESKGLMDRYFHQNHSSNNLSVLALGWAGGLVATQGLRLPFFLAAILICLSLFLIFKSFRHQVHVHTHSPSTLSPRGWLKRMTDHLSETYHAGLKNPVLWPFFLANVLIQFSIQPLLHYWQPAFQGILEKNNPAILGNIFAAYCGASALLSVAYSRVTKYSWARSPAATFGLFLAFSIFYYFFSVSRSFTSAFIFFILLQAFLGIARTSLGIRLNEVIPSQYRSSILSSVGLISRIGMMVALYIIGKILDSKNSGESIFTVLRWFSYGTFMILFILILGITLKSILKTYKFRGKK